MRLHNERYARGEETFIVELNQFADMDTFEFAAIYTGRKDVKATKQCKGQI